MKQHVLECFLESVSGYSRYINQDCGGNDFVGPNTAASPRECGSLCDQTLMCVGFVFEGTKTETNCHLKNVCENLTELKDVHTYKRLEGLLLMILLSLLSHFLLSYTSYYRAPV